ncbi:alkaline phosphatase D family protein [Pontiella agarivorans]|uniref:Alkaline phosphatase D family protein n=1 Tax=Pontiella agarivorans TaxID=3038953 RepID=A0ABU5N1C1_9BACT|nr:alkaline phosphatase D family protein [Pontiella agarivorans]MDZ8120250.1 alkaline phosphatase D family protein [Pontiella agarivorans]
MVNRKSFIVSMGGVSVLGALPVWAKGTSTKLDHKFLKGPGLDASMAILNLWGEAAPNKQKMLSLAFAYLNEAPDGSFSGLMQQPEFVALCRASGITHLGGPMLGGISETGARVWIRTLRPSSVSVEINGMRFGPVSSTEESDLTAVVVITGLKPGKEYSYRVLIDDQPIRTDSSTTIRTVPVDHAATRIAFGSCWHRWGIGHPQMDVIRSRKPVAMLMIGDIALQDRLGHLGLQRHDVLLRDLAPRWQRFVSEIPGFASWDDHDYGANDLSGISPEFSVEDQANTRRVFTQSWVNPSYGSESDSRGIFMRTRIGPADVILTDNRTFRRAKNEKYAFLGEEQMAWLKEQLLDCKGPFIILSCGTMWTDFVSNGKDSWGAFDPQGREELFSFIEEQGIKGVLLISGDRHGARGFTIPRKNGFKFYEFGAASLGGRRGPPATNPNWTTQLYGIMGRFAFSEFEFNTTLPDPEVTYRLLDEVGNPIYRLTLTRSQLTP